MATDLGFNQDQLGSLISKIKDDPSVAATEWRASTRWKRGFQSEATIRSHVVPMDEPHQLGGDDTAPNMVEVVLGAYGCCLTTGFVANAGMLGIELEAVEIELSGDLDLHAFFGLRDPQEISPGYTEVRAAITLKASSASREQLESLYNSVVPTSPVGGIISRPVRIVTELRHGPTDGRGADTVGQASV